MKELVTVEVSNTLGTITSNLDDVEKNVREVVEEYTSIAITEDNLTDSKKVRADLNKLRTNLDNKRKDIKKEWDKPFKEFENRVKRIIALYDDGLKCIDDQLNGFEEDRRDRKRSIIRDIYDNVMESEDAELTEYVSLESIYNPKWENATYKEDAILNDIHDVIDKVSMEIQTIKTLESKYEDKGLEEYKKNRDMQAAISLMTTYKKQEEVIKERQDHNDNIAAACVNYKTDTDVVRFEIAKKDMDTVKWLFSEYNIEFKEI